MSVSESRRRLSGLLLGGVMLFNTGCYTYEPLVSTRPAPGQRVSLELSDQGRAAVGEQLGTGVLEVEGTLQDIQNDQYVVGVSRVTTIGGGTANWGGERVRIPVSAVSRSGLRTLSPGRTALAIGLVAAGVVAVIVTRNLIGGGTISSSDTTHTPPAGTSRVPP